MQPLFVMRNVTRHLRTRAGRLATAAALAVVLAATLPAVASHATGRASLAAAKQRLNALLAEQGQLVEQYDQATVRLARVRQALTGARRDIQVAEQQAQHFDALVAAGATAAYESTGPELAVLLESTSLAQLTDRVQFLQTLSQRNRDAAERAMGARARALRARATLTFALAEQTALAGELKAKRSQIERSIATQRGLVHRIEAEIHRPIVIDPPAPTPPHPVGGTGGTGGGSPSGGGSSGGSGGGSGGAGSGGGGGTPPPPPPPSGSGAEAAIQAAESVIGDAYVFGAAGPTTFDCSGLTMWAWAHAGVALPHSAAMQYAMLPPVPRSDLQPGDLMFFYTPIDHVGLYIGNGMMIDAPHTGSTVGVRPVYWSAYVGAGRP